MYLEDRAFLAIRVERHNIYVAEQSNKPKEIAPQQPTIEDKWFRSLPEHGTIQNSYIHQLWFYCQQPARRAGEKKKGECHAMRVFVYDNLLSFKGVERGRVTRDVIREWRQVVLSINTTLSSACDVLLVRNYRGIP